MFKNAEDKEYYKKCKEKVKEWQLRNKEFTENNNLKRDFTRENVEKVTKVQKDGIMTKNINREDKELHYIGKIDKNKIGKYANKITTDEVVLTDERKLHIFEDHEKDYETIINNIDRVVLNPKEVLEDCKNKDTLFFIDKLEKNNLNVVVRLNTTNNREHPQNSVMTAWIIRDKNLRKFRERNKTIYKDE